MRLPSTGECLKQPRPNASLQHWRTPLQAPRAAHDAIVITENDQRFAEITRAIARDYGLASTWSSRVHETLNLPEWGVQRLRRECS